MTDDPEPGPGPGKARPRPGSQHQPVLAAIMVLISALVLAVAVNQTSITYALPAAPGSHGIHNRSGTYGPGVLATVVAVLAGLSAVGWLIWSVVGQSPRRLGVVVGGLLVLAVVITAGVAISDRPSY